MNSGIKPLFDNMIAQETLKRKGEKNMFSIFLGDYEGAIQFGGYSN
jgi:hypothetical protein